MPKQEIISLLDALGFKTDVSKDIYSKEYKDHKYTISIDFQKKKICYEKPIEVGDETATHFAR